MNKFLAALGFGLLIWAAPAGAQTSTMRFDIPFSFVAGNQVMPAGEYRVTVDTEFYMARFEPLGERTIQTVRLMPGVTDRSPYKSSAGSVRFKKYGGTYFFNGVWKPGSVAGNEAIPNKRMVESAKAGQSPELVSVAGN